jgi:hypothetical protein
MSKVSKHAIVIHRCGSIYDHVLPHLRIGLDYDARKDDTSRSDRHGLVHLGAWMNN